MTKIALVADIHGNQTALEAVVADIKTRDVAESWVLGDVVLPGPASNRLFELLAEINTTVKLRGNWDDVFLSIVDHPADIDTTDPSGVYLGSLAKYLLDRLNPTYVKGLQQAPIQQEVTLNEIKMSLTHNTLDANGGPQVLPSADTQNFDQLFKDESIDVAIYGHVHHQIMRHSHQDQLILNPGSVGEPFFGHAKLNNDRRAQYALLEIDETGIVDVTFKKVSYDIALELERAKQAEVPYLDLYRRLLMQGISPTQDKPLLAEYNQRFNYQESLEAFLAEKE